ncbi:MAG TPA: TolC family protein [Thermoanaerobaculia bacterium]|nr:TolC family protein [Thermoanaerobaculia bacterium]
MSAGAQTVSLTFEDALSRALHVNNDIERSRAGVGVAEANRLFLMSAVLPRISANGALTRNSIEQSFGEGADAITILPRNDWNYSITLSQPIFAGRRELRAYSQAKLGIENAREVEQATADATLLRVASSYLALVNAGARMEIERRNIELAEKRRQQAQAFFDAGEVTRVDVLRAETAVKAAQRVLAGADQARQFAESDLRQALELDGSIEPAPPARRIPSPPDEEALLRRAASGRPDLDVARNNVRIAGLEVSKQRGYRLPLITFDGGLVHQRTPFPADRFSYGALRFNVPLFQSGEVAARVAGARHRELQAELALEDARLAAREDVRRALAALRAAETGLSLAAEQLVAAEAEYAQAFELYRAQEATSLDVATSEASLADARRAVAEETLNRDLAELRVWYAAGAIQEALNINGVKR